MTFSKLLTTLTCLLLLGGEIQAQYDLSPSQAYAQAPQPRVRRILLFTADWCRPCRELRAGLIYDLKNRHKWHVGTGPESTIQIIDVDQRRQLAANYNIRSVPTMVFIGRPDGVNLRVTNPLKYTAASLRAEWDRHYGVRAVTTVAPTSYTAPVITETVTYAAPTVIYETPVAAPVVTEPTWYHYPSEGAQDTHSLARHLSQEHGIPMSRLRGLSYSQLRAIHSNAHNSGSRRRSPPGLTLPALRIQSPIQLQY